MQGDQLGFFRVIGPPSRNGFGESEEADRIPGEIRSIKLFGLGEYLSDAADRLGYTPDEIREMSFEEIELLNESHVRNEAKASQTRFETLIAFLKTAMPDNQKAFDRGKAEAEKILRNVERRTEYGLTEVREDELDGYQES